MLLPRFCCIEVTHKNDRSGLVLRYIERNPLRAGLVQRAEE